jgi:hypothetical protein
MLQLKASGDYAIYRGHQYSVYNGGGNSVCIIRPPDSTESDFPDAVEFLDIERLGGAARVPLQVVSRLWSDHVHGRWKDVEFTFSLYPDWNGKIIFSGTTTNPKAGKLGLRGDQYSGWGGFLPPDEVELTYHEVWEYSTDEKGVHIKTTKIYYDENGNDLPPEAT